MKKNLWMLSLLLFGFMGQTYAQDGYNITVRMDNYENDTLILGYRLGPQTYVKDTAVGKNSKNEYVFKGDEYMKGGVYIILTKPDNIYFEFLVPNEEDQKTLYLHTSAEDNDMTSRLKVKGSKDNEVFIDYLHFLASERQKSQDLQKERAEAEEKGDTKTVEKIDGDLKKLDEGVKAYQTNMETTYADYLCVKLIQASTYPTVPQELQGEDKKVEAYYYYKAHYFDNFDWSDMRLIRTPIMENKVDYFLDKLTVQHPDSVAVGVDYLMDKVIEGGDKDMYQYMASHLLNKYAKSEVICMDAVYVHIGEKYYCSAGQKADWVKEEQLEKICENVRTLKPLRCGQYAPNFELTVVDQDKPIQLYSVKAKYTIVYFWDPTCGNCTKNSKKLAPLYNEWKEKGWDVEIVGVCSKAWSEKDACIKKMDEVGMKWINCSDEPYDLAVVKKLYDVKVNPFIYMLDENKKIIWKRLEPNQVNDILEREYNGEGK